MRVLYSVHHQKIVRSAFGHLLLHLASRIRINYIMTGYLSLEHLYTDIDNSTDYGHMMIDDVRIVYYQRAKILSINLSS